MNVSGKPRPSSLLSIFVIVILDLILIAISWLVGRPSINGTALFFSGLVALFVGYGLDRLFWGGGSTKMGFPGSVPDYGTEYERFQREEGGVPGSDLAKVKRAPIFLRDLTIAGVIAIILSFILPRLF